MCRQATMIISKCLQNAVKEPKKQTNGVVDCFEFNSGGNNFPAA